MDAMESGRLQHIDFSEEIESMFDFTKTQMEKSVLLDAIDEDYISKSQVGESQIKVAKSGEYVLKFGEEKPVVSDEVYMGMWDDHMVKSVVVDEPDEPKEAEEPEPA